MVSIRTERDRLFSPRVYHIAPGIHDGRRPTAGAADDLELQLERQTQELLDAVAGGNRDPWTRYLHQDLIYTAEDGSIKSKAQLVEEVQPLPKPIWGKLRVTRFRTVRHGSTAVCSYVAEEDEGYYGQTIHARYLSTDTWIETPEGWRLIASQVLALRDDPPQLTLPKRRSISTSGRTPSRPR